MCHECVYYEGPKRPIFTGRFGDAASSGSQRTEAGDPLLPPPQHHSSGSQRTEAEGEVVCYGPEEAASTAAAIAATAAMDSEVEAPTASMDGASPVTEQVEEMDHESEAPTTSMDTDIGANADDPPIASTSDTRDTRNKGI